MSARPPEANGWTPTLKRAPEIVEDVGIIPRVLHIPLSSEKQLGKTGWTGPRLPTTCDGIGVR